MEIINNLFTKYNIQFPFNYLILSIGIVLILFIFFPVFGKLIDLLAQLEYIIFDRLFNHKVAFFIINRLTFVGVMIHELAHALFAFIFGAKVVKINLFTIFKGDTLGHVDFILRGGLIRRKLQLFYSSLAPVLVNVSLSILLIFLWSKINLWYVYIIFVYLIISLLNHASMSNADLKLYFKGAPIAVPFTITILFVCMLLFRKVA